MTAVLKFQKHWLLEYRYPWRWLGSLTVWLLLVLPAQAALELRVAVVQELEQIDIGSSTPGIIRDGTGQAIYQLPGLQSITVTADDGELALTAREDEAGADELAESSAFWLEPETDGLVWIGGKWYRGRVRVVPTADGLTAINYVDLERYLYSVVGSEMPTSWPQAALQAQAVAARSYALYKQQRAKNPLYELGGTDAYQVYGGVAQEAPSTVAAVDATAGQVLTYSGQIIEAVFHSSSGGHTENAGEIWSSDVPYLRGVPDYDQGAPVFQWLESFSRADFSTRIGDIGLVTELGDPRRTSWGRIVSMEIEGEDGAVTLRGSELRQKLGLRSTRFSLEYHPESDLITATGGGYGHGIGLSQWGARGLADQGWSYDQILRHYYQQTELARFQVQ